MTAALGRIWNSRILSSAVIGCCMVAMVGTAGTAGTGTVTYKPPSRPAERALSFVPNVGQTDPRAKYLARAGQETFFLTGEGIMISASSHHRSLAFELRFLGANRNPTIEGASASAATVNYFLGNNPAAWKAYVRTYDEVIYRALWPGVDLHVRASGGQLEYEFHVSPGAPVNQIRLAYAGTVPALDSQGNLKLQTALGTLTDSRPTTYQVLANARTSVVSSYALDPSGSFSFVVGAYDQRRTLVIDPNLVYSTFLGGSNSDQGIAIAVDSTGSAYVASITDSADFPTTVGAFRSTAPGGNDVAISKLSPDGSTLIYSTYLGGSAQEIPGSIALDSAGDAYVIGRTESTNFPTTPGAFSTALGGAIDGFVTKLNAAGSDLLYSTYLGGSGDDTGQGIAVDSAGNAYVDGNTWSADFPTTTGAFQTTFHTSTQTVESVDVFAAKLNPTGTGLVYSTFLGGTDTDSVDLFAAHPLAIDAAGNAYVVGLTLSKDFPTTAGSYQPTWQTGDVEEAFVSKLGSTGASLVYSTYLGGTNGENEATSVAVDAAGEAYIVGWSNCGDFPVSAGAFDTTYKGEGDGFVTKLNSSGSAPVYSSYLGGSGIDVAQAIAIDGSGTAYVAGLTGSTDFPTTSNAFATTYAGAATDAFLSKVNAGGSSLTYSTYFGGSGADTGQGIAVDNSADAFLTGRTTSGDFPVSAAAYGTYAGGGDGFVAKFSTGATPADQISALISLVNSEGLSRGITNSLLAKLQAASAALAAGNTKTACNNLAAFINEVQAQSGKAIPTSVATDLIASAEQIQSTVC